MRALPQLYGDTTYSHPAPITDWRSGSIVGGKSFTEGLRQGASDIFSQTFARKKREGAKGVAKGLAMRVVSLTAKTSAAVVGVVAYPCQGVYRSLYSALHKATGERVEEAKWEEANWIRGKDSGDRGEVVQAFLKIRAET